MSHVNTQVPDTGTLKIQAKRLRAEMLENGVSISHSKALEMLAHQYGFKDWNGLCAAAGNNSLLSTLRVGQRVKATYLGQRVIGEIIGLQKLSAGGRYHLTLDLDQAVDVVKFDSFSNMRKRISCRIDDGGVSLEKTSDGRPHMVITGRA